MYKTGIVPTRNVYRMMYCGHNKCQKITAHELNYRNTIFDQTKTEWNVVFNRKCLDCQKREHTESILDIIGCDDWNALMNKEIFAKNEIQNGKST